MNALRPISVADIAAVAQKTAIGKRRMMIAVDGPGAVGKSTLSRSLAAQIPRCTVVQVDDFYLPSAERGPHADGIGSAYDLRRLSAQVLAPAAAGDAFRYQRYDWPSDNLAEWVDVPADVPVVIEGVYSMKREFRGHYSLTIFCATDSGTRLSRGLARDGEAARHLWEGEWMPAEDRYIAAEEPDREADMLLDTSGDSPDGVLVYRLQSLRV